jgi:hypothetical protein
MACPRIATAFTTGRRWSGIRGRTVFAGKAASRIGYVIYIVAPTTKGTLRMGQLTHSAVGHGNVTAKIRGYTDAQGRAIDAR